MPQTSPPEENQASQPSQDAHLDPVGQNIATVAEIRAQYEQQVDRHQRAAENIADWLGHARFLYLLIFLMVAWVVVNVFAHSLGIKAFDPSPFNLLISFVNVAALLISSVVLISQNRQSKGETRRAHLDLQINMLNDQRTAKIIALLEELRRDMPSVKNRIDPEAQALAATINPKDVLEALESTLEHAASGAHTPDTSPVVSNTAASDAVCETVIMQEQQHVEQKLYAME